MTVWKMCSRILNHDGLCCRLCKHRYVYADMVVMHPDILCDIVGMMLSLYRQNAGNGSNRMA